MTRTVRWAAAVALGAVLPLGASASAAVDFAPRLTVRTDESPTAVAVADVTGDGVADLISGSRSAPQVTIHRGLGGGAFASGVGIDAAGPVLAIATGDFDEDGDVDLAATGSDRFLTILSLDGRGFPTATDTRSVGGSPATVLAGDLNADGHLDLVTVNGDSRNASVLLGAGPAGFGPPAFVNIGDFPVDGVLADVNEDGRPDIVAAAQTPPGITITAGNGDGTFARHVRLGAGPRPSGVAAADLNRDGHPDLLAVNELGNEVTLQLGLGGGAFTAGHPALTSTFPSDIAVGDWSGDGIPDVAATNNGSDDVTILEGGAGGRLKPGRQFQVGRGPAALTSADVDGDARADLVVVNGDGRGLTVLRQRPRVGRGTAKGRRSCPPARRLAVSSIETRCVELGMSPAQVRELLGPPRAARVMAGGASVRWHYPKLLVRFSRTLNLVTSVRTLAPGARTADGLPVGAHVGDLERRLDPDLWVCARSGAVQTCTSFSLFTLTRYRAVSGRIAWIEVLLLQDVLDLL